MSEVIVSTSTGREATGIDRVPGDGDRNAIDADQAEPDAVDDASAAAAHRRSLLEVARNVTRPQAIMAAVVVVYVAYMTRRSIDIHQALGTSTYDVALYDQGIWLLSRFETPFVTLMGRNLFGDHSSFVLLLLVPLYWIWPAAGVLYFAQSAALGAGAIPVFLYARSRLSNEWFALALGSAYLLHPAIGWTNLENFHPDSFLGVFVGFAIWAALERKWKTYAVFVVLALLVKEDASLLLVPLGVWVGVRRNWRIGLVTAAGSLAFMAVAMLVVMRGLVGVPTRNGWRIPFGGVRGVIDTAVTNPTELADHLRGDGRPWYLIQMTAPFAWLFARKPTVAIISGVVLFTNVLSTFWYQYQIQFHYSVVAVPALSLGTVHAIGAIRERTLLRRPAFDRTLVLSARTVSVGAVGLAALITSFMWSPVPWGRTPLFYGYPSNPWASSAHEIIDVLPPDAIVSAHYRITPHIAHRREVYQFPTPFRSVLYGTDGNVDGPRIDDRAERVEYVVLSADTNDYPYVDWLVIESAFEFVEANEFWIVYRRDFEVPLPPALVTEP